MRIKSPGKRCEKEGFILEGLISSRRKTKNEKMGKDTDLYRVTEHSGYNRGIHVGLKHGYSRGPAMKILTLSKYSE